MKFNSICHNCFEFVFPGYWHFENVVTRVSEDILLDPYGLPHVPALAVPLLIFGWMVRGDHSEKFLLKGLFTRALLHG